MIRAALALLALLALGCTGPSSMCINSRTTIPRADGKNEVIRQDTCVNLKVAPPAASPMLIP